MKRTSTQQATLRRRLAALEKRWAAALLAPHEAVQLCVESGLPRHLWPRWIEPAAAMIQPRLKRVRDLNMPRPKPVPMTGPEQTRFLASLALWCTTTAGVAAVKAAATTVSAYSAFGFPQGAKVVARVKREMQKQVADPSRKLTLNGEQIARVIPHLRLQSRKKPK